MPESINYHLVDWVGPSVTDCDTDEVEILGSDFLSLVDGVGEVRHVFAAVRFAWKV